MAYRSATYICCCCWCRKSRWLLSKGRKSGAGRAGGGHGSAHRPRELNSFKRSQHENRAIPASANCYGRLGGHDIRLRIAFFQQATGINCHILLICPRLPQSAAGCRRPSRNRCSWSRECRDDFVAIWLIERLGRSRCSVSGSPAATIVLTISWDSFGDCAARGDSPVSHANVV